VSALRIAMLCAPGLGGSSVVAIELARALVARGHRVDLISTDPPVRLRDAPATPGLRVHAVRGPAHPVYRQEPDTLALASAAARIVRGDGAALIHAHYALPYGAAGLLASEMTGRPLVLTLHGTDVVGVGDDPRVAPVVDHVIARAAVVTAVSPHLRERALDRLSAARRIEVVPNFVAARRWSGQPGTEAGVAGPAARKGQEPGPAPAAGRPGLVHVSNFRPVKRPLDAVRILAAVRDQGVDVALTAFGDGPLREDARRLAEGLRVAPALALVGTVPAGPRFLPGQVLLAPSEEEAFGLAALEALAAGIPVVGSRVGGLVDLVEAGALPPAGALHPVGEVDGMARSAAWLLRDPQAYARASAAAAERARAYGEEPAVTGYLDAYQEALRPGSSRTPLGAVRLAAAVAAAGGGDDELGNGPR